MTGVSTSTDSSPDTLVLVGGRGVRMCKSLVEVQGSGLSLAHPRLGTTSNKTTKLCFMFLGLHWHHDHKEKL